MCALAFFRSTRCIGVARSRVESAIADWCVEMAIEMPERVVFLVATFRAARVLASVGGDPEPDSYSPIAGVHDHSPQRCFGNGYAGV